MPPMIMRGISPAKSNLIPPGIWTAAVGAETGIVDVSGWGTTASLSGFQLGWEFTVGPADLTVTALRLYTAAARTERVKLWKVSDQSLVTEADVAADGYAETEITPVTLTAATAYVVSTYFAGSRQSAADPSSRTFNVATPFTQGRVATSAGFPTITTTIEHLAPDIRFDVS